MNTAFIVTLRHPAPVKLIADAICKLYKLNGLLGRNPVESASVLMGEVLEHLYSHKFAGCTPCAVQRNLRFDEYITLPLVNRNNAFLIVDICVACASEGMTPIFTIEADLAANEYGLRLLLTGWQLHKYPLLPQEGRVLH